MPVNMCAYASCQEPGAKYTVTRNFNGKPTDRDRYCSALHAAAGIVRWHLIEIRNSRQPDLAQIRELVKEVDQLKQWLGQEGERNAEAKPESSGNEA